MCVLFTWYIYCCYGSSLRTNPLALSLGQVKLDSDKWKLWKNLFEQIEKISKFGFRASKRKKMTKTAVNVCSNSLTWQIKNTFLDNNLSIRCKSISLCFCCPIWRIVSKKQQGFIILCIQVCFLLSKFLLPHLLFSS